MATPPYFWYKTFGVSDYSARGGGTNLNVAALHTQISRNVLDFAQYMGSTNISNLSYDDAIVPSDVEYAYAPLNNCDFAIFHAHGEPPDCPADMPSFWLGGDKVNGPWRVYHSRLRFGGLSWGYLKWIYAASCGWFDVNWQHYNITPVSVSGVMDFSDGLSTFTSIRARGFIAAGPEYPTPTYLSQGINVNNSSLQGCSTNDSYKRCKFFSTFNGKTNVLVLKVSAPGTSSQFIGKIAVRVGTLPRVSNSTWGPGETITTVDIYGSGGSPREYRIRLMRNGQPAYLDDFAGYAAYDLYLYFSNCNTDLTVDDVCFYYYPLEDAGVTLTMQTRVDCYNSAMYGTHAILGFSNTIIPVNMEEYNRQFFTNWLVQSRSTSTAFLSIQTLDIIPYVFPAVAVPIGPSGDRYKYLFETWSSATDDPAPGGACMIAWCMPFFNQGYYFFEE